MYLYFFEFKTTQIIYCTTVSNYSYDFLLKDFMGKIITILLSLIYNW